MLAAVNPINDLIDELSLEGGICVAYTTDGCSKSVSLKHNILYCNQIHSPYDEDDQPIDPEVFLAHQMVDLISKLEQVKAVLLKKYPPKPPVGEVQIEKSELFGVPAQVVVLPPGMSVSDYPDDFGQEDIAAADAAASQVAGSVLQVAGLVGRGLPS